jgi:hypothetical protein
MPEQPVCGFFRFGQAFLPAGWFVPVDPAPGSGRVPWENYATLPEAPCNPAEWFLAVAGEDYAEAGALSEFEAAVLEECIAEAMSAPLSELFTGDQRICSEAQWYYGPTVGNA